MPKKAEAGSIKDLAKRMKMKGLQKLRFWCEMCQKQCRDANGFKCHLQSEQHLRQMKVFSEQAGSIVQQKSKQFEAAFLETLRLYHSTCQVNANNVYQQVIRDKTHVHMNATMWATLSDFVQYLGKQGKVKVQETPKGWYVQYIPVVSVQERIKQEQQQEQAAADAAAEAALEVQREKARRQAVLEHYHQQQQQQTSDDNNNANIATVVEATKLERRNSTKEGGSGDGDDDVAATTTMIRLNLPNAATAAIGKKNAIGKIKLKKPSPPSLFDNASDSDDDDDDEQQGLPLPSPPIPFTTSEKKRKADKDAAAATTQKLSNDAATKPPSSKRTRLDEDNNNNNKKNHHRHQDDSISSSAALAAAAAAVVLNDPQVWLYPGIVVRIIDSTQHEYYKQKAVVQQVSLSNEESETKKKKKIRAQVQLVRQSDNSNNDKHDKTLTLLQKHLETVVPKEQVDHNNNDDDDDNVVVYLAHGKYRGERAIVTKLDKTKYRANLRLLKTNKVLEKVDFEDFSLLAPK